MLRLDIFEFLCNLAQDVRRDILHFAFAVDRQHPDFAIPLLEIVVCFDDYIATQRLRISGGEASVAVCWIPGLGGYVVCTALPVYDCNSTRSLSPHSAKPIFIALQ